MLLGPTDAIYDAAKAGGPSVRAYGERGANTITPANATWTDIYQDWKNHTANVAISGSRDQVGLRDSLIAALNATMIRGKKSRRPLSAERSSGEQGRVCGLAGAIGSSQTVPARGRQPPRCSRTTRPLRFSAPIEM